MKHAVVLANPKTTSFCAAIARTCMETLDGLGHQAVLRDLYAMHFDPRLRADEIPAVTPYRPAPDVVAERTLLAGVDSFIFVYPFWFNAPPAILKGYIDRVLSMGFGYAPGADGGAPLLTGRRLTTFSTSGAPDRWVDSTGALKGLIQGFDQHLAGVCGLTLDGHHHFGGIHSMLAEPAAADMLNTVSAKLTAAFAKIGARPG